MNRLLTIFRIPELRQKILITLVFLAVFRLGAYIPLPIVDQSRVQQNIEQQRGDPFGHLLGMISIFAASDIGQSTIFGLGIMPYISASIIFQLLASVWGPLERLQKEGESGRKKINEYTRYATVGLCILQSFMWMRYLVGQGLLYPEYSGFGFQLAAVLTMTAGTIFLMWIGEQIDEYGIGNGISLLIMAGIVARMPQAGQYLLENATVALGSSAEAPYGLETLIVLALLFVGVVVGVVAMTQAQRRIPTQSAKHVRGRKVYGGTRQYLPLRVNQSGVMPIIFASSLLMIPAFLFGWLAGLTGWWIFDELAESFGPAGHGYLYNVTYVILIYAFCYFWTAITFNPKDMANSLKDHGSFIPGIRPGRRTAEFLEQVMVRITYVGAAFLAIVAVIPTLVSSSVGIPFLVASFYGGTGLLIVVSVGLDLIQKIDSHLVMRNYPGLLEKAA